VDEDLGESDAALLATRELGRATARLGREINPV
jgi:hypothetical protein